MKSRVKLALGLLVTAGMVTACSGGAADGGDGPDGYPNETVEMIVPFGAGGATDTVARSYASALEDIIGERVVVVNRPGGGGAIAATEAAGAKPDGQTLFLVTAGPFVTTPLMDDVSYTPEEDFKGVAGIADQPYVVIVGNDSGWDSLEDVAQADDRLTYGVTGMGNNTHLVGGMFFDEAEIEAEPVPFDAATNAIQAVSGGQVDFAAVDLNVAMPQIEAGSVKAIGLTSAERNDRLPDVETLAEAGYEEISEIQSRIGVVVPSGVSDELVDYLSEVSQEAINGDEFQEFLKANLLTAAEYSDGEALINEWLPAERERAQTAFDSLGIATGK